MVYALTCIFRYFKEHNIYLFSYGVILLLIWLMLGYKLSRETAQKNILLSNIFKIIIFKSSLSGKMSAKIILKSKKIRPFVLETGNGQDLEFITLIKNENVSVIEKS